jgi:hypothetical protein
MKHHIKNGKLSTKKLKKVLKKLSLIVNEDELEKATFLIGGGLFEFLIKQHSL